jgi:hypothetical protein
LGLDQRQIDTVKAVNTLSPTQPAKPAHAAANAAAASFAALMAKLDYLSTDEVEQVRRAYRLADEAHLGQLRSSGEPYITHPIAWQPSVPSGSSTPRP